MNGNELKKFIDEKKVECVKLRFDIAAKQVANHRALRTAKKDIAKALTLIKQGELSK